MYRTLSVRQTGLLKFVLPPVWIALAGYASWQLWFHPADILGHGDSGRTTRMTLTWLLLALLAVSLGILSTFVVPLKRVRLTPAGLEVSNYRREITVPFNDIAHVRQKWLPTFRLVTIDLRRDTPLGRTLIFMPAGAQRAAFWRQEYWRESDVVGELRRLAGLTE